MTRLLLVLSAVAAFAVVALIIFDPIVQTLHDFRYLIAAFFLLAILIATISALPWRRA